MSNQIPFESTEDEQSLQFITSNHWVLLGYKNKKKIVFIEKGDGSVDDLHDKLKEDSVNFVINRIPILNDTQTKYVLIMWSGSKVKALMRSRSTQHRELIQKYVEKNIIKCDFNLVIKSVSAIDELTEKEVISRIFGSGSKIRGESLYEGANAEMLSTSEDRKNLYLKALESSPLPLSPQGSTSVSKQMKKKDEKRKKYAFEEKRKMLEQKRIIKEMVKKALKNVTEENKPKKVVVKKTDEQIIKEFVKRILNSCTRKNKPSNNTKKSKKVGLFLKKLSIASQIKQEEINKEKSARKHNVKLGIRDQITQRMTMDKESLTDALGKMKENECRWIVLTYDEEGKVYILEKQEEFNSNNDENMKKLLLNVKQDDVYFILFRINMGQASGYGEDNEKIELIQHVGKDVSSIRRAKTNQDCTDIYEFCQKIIQLAGIYKHIEGETEPLTAGTIQRILMGHKGKVYTEEDRLQNETKQKKKKKKKVDPTKHYNTISFKNIEKKPKKSKHVLDSGVLCLKISNEAEATKHLNMMRDELNTDYQFALFEYDNSMSQLKLVENVGNKGIPLDLYLLEKLRDSPSIENEVQPLASETIDTAVSKDRESSEIEKFVSKCLTNVSKENTEAPKNEWITNMFQDSDLKYFVVKNYLHGKEEGTGVVRFEMIAYRGPLCDTRKKVMSGSHAMRLIQTIHRIMFITSEVKFCKTPEQIIDVVQEDKEKRIIDWGEAKKAIQNSKELKEQKKKEHKHKRSKTLSNVISQGSIIKFQFEDENKVVEALKDLNSDETPSNWFMITTNEKNELYIPHSGSEGLEELTQYAEDDKVIFFFFKTLTESTGYGGSPKIVLIAYIGENAKPTMKAQAPSNRVQLQRFSVRHVPVAGEYQAANKSELNLESIQSKITGIRNDANQEEGVKFLSTKKSFISGGAKHDLTFNNQEEFDQQIEDLKNDENGIDWLMYEYGKSESLENEKDNQNVLTFYQKGKEGYDEFVKLFTEDKVFYVIYKAHVFESGYGRSIKIMIITWVGEKVTGIQRSITSTHRQLLKFYVEEKVSVAAEYQANTQEDLDKRFIIGKLTGSKGRFVSQEDIDKQEEDLESTKSAFARTQSMMSFGGRSSNLKLEENQEVIEAIKDLASLKTDTKWLMFEYKDPEDLYSITPTHKGTGQVHETQQHLSDDSVAYIVTRLSFLEYGTVAKGVLVTWVGENVPHFLKALSAGHRNNLHEFTCKFFNLVGQFQPYTLKDVNGNALIAKITGTGDGDGEDQEELTPEEETLRRFEAYRQIGPKVPVFEEFDSFTGKFKALEYEGKDELDKALTRMKSDYEDENVEWEHKVDFIKLVVKSPTFRSVEVEDVGNGCLTEEWIDDHLDDNEVATFVFAINTSEKQYGMVTKFFYVQWIGSKIKHLKRAKASEINPTLYHHVDEVLHLSGEIQGAQAREELTRENILAKLLGTKIRSGEMQIQKKQAKYKVLKEKKSKLTYEDKDKIIEAVGDLVNDENPLNWIGITYKEDSIDVLVMDGKGDKHIEEFTEKFQDKEVYFVVHRVMHAFGYNRDLEHLKKPYYNMIHWQGKDTTILERGFSSYHFETLHKMIGEELEKLKTTFQGGHYHCESLDEVNLGRIKKIMNLDD